METPECIRLQYASPGDPETPEERRRRLASKRAAKYRLSQQFKAQNAQVRHQNALRQRRRRSQLDEAAIQRAREQNRRRQQQRRDALSEQEREVVREQQKQRQRLRRQRLDDQEREQVRQEERIRRRQQRHKQQRAQREENERYEASLRSPSRPLDIILPPAPIAISRAPQPLTQVALPPATLRHSDSEVPALQLQLRHPSHNSCHHPHFIHSQHRGVPVAPLQFPLPPSASLQANGQLMSFLDRMPQLPHLQATLTQPSPSVLNTSAPQSSVYFPPIAGSGQSSMLPGPVSSTAIPSLASATSSSLPSQSSGHQLSLSALAPPSLPVRALPPLPDFLNAREAFDPPASSIFFPSISELSHFGGDFHDSDVFFRS